MKHQRSSKRARTVVFLAAAATAASGLVGIAGTGTASAAPVPVELNLNYTCVYPLIGTKDIKVKISAEIVDEVAVGEEVPQFPVKAETTILGDTTEGLYTMGAATIEGDATAVAVIDGPDGPVDANTDVLLDKTNVPESGEFKVNANGQSPVSFGFTQEGWGRVNIGNLNLNVTPKDAAGNETVLGKLAVKCYQKPGQNNVLHQFYVKGDSPKPPKPGPVSIPTDPAPAFPPTAQPSQSNSKTLNYNCVFPVLLGEPLTVKATIQYPNQIEKNRFAPRIAIQSVSTLAPATMAGIHALATPVATLAGSAIAQAPLTVPELPTSPLVARVKLPIDQFNVPPKPPVGTPEQPLDIKADGSAPSLVFTQSGAGNMKVGNIALNMIAKTPTGALHPQLHRDPKNPTGPLLPSFPAPCTLNTGQENTITEFTILGGDPTPDTQAPTVPANVAVAKGTPATTSLKVTWDPSTDLPNPGGTGVGGYKVSQNGVEVATVTSPEYTANGLTPGTKYTYTVKAFDKATPTANTSAASAPDDGTTDPLPQPPAAVTDLAGTPTDTTVALTWKPSNGASSYEVSYDGKKETVTAPSFTATGLTPEKEYDFSVVAINDAGSSDPRSITVKTLKPPPAKPAPVTDLAGTPTDTTVALTWTASAGATSYEVSYNGKKETVTAPAFTATGLTPETPYEFTVVAVNGAGASDPRSVEVTTLKPPPAKPAPVTDLTGTPTATTVALTWAASAGATSYEVSYDGKKQTVTAPAFIATGLTPEKEYEFTVVAINDAGRSDPRSVKVTTLKAPPQDSFNYKLTGTSFIKAPNGNVPLTGGITGKIGADGKFAGDLTLNNTSGSFRLLGFVPATADIAFLQSGQTTGTLTGSNLTSNSKVTVKLPKVKVFGLEIGGGATCQTTSPADITLKSSSFSKGSGGTLTGAYTLPSVKGCGPLTAVISALMAGPGNTATVKLAP